MSGNVLLIDDDPDLLALLEAALQSEGLSTLRAESGAAARACLAQDAPAAVVLDLMLPDVRGQDLLKEMREERPCLPVVVLTAKEGVEDVVECMQLGAADYVSKPLDTTRFVTSLRNAMERGRLLTQLDSLTRELRTGQGFSNLIGNSEPIRKAVELLQRGLKSDVTILLSGESGTGKEVAARAVHAESRRSASPFVPVNCGAIPEGLIESELFGHTRGAFTGAGADKPGVFELATGGTLFLDEVGELRIDLQVKLLRVLQERRVRRLGATRSIPVDVRVLAATNRDLKEATRAREFREDLYYRLAVFPVVLPPLRERAGDILLLAEQFLLSAAQRHGQPVTQITEQAREALERYSWPGNVRELKNVIERAVILEDSPALSLSSLPDDVVCTLDEGSARPALPGGGAPILPFEEEERRILQNALDVTQGNVREAASRLGIGRATLYRKVERYGLRAGAKG